jgi:ArsR family transcriptional regulator
MHITTKVLRNMDELSATLFDRLVDKTFANMNREERLDFIEKLFLDLPPAAQQEFLLKLARRGMSGRAEFDSQYGLERQRGPTFMRQMMAQGPPAFGPWQMCCQAMNNLVELPQVDRDQAAPIARVFSALADETRLKIVKQLSEREYSVEELVKLLSIAQSTTSHHLRILKEAGLIQGDKRGRSIYYSLIQPIDVET